MNAHGEASFVESVSALAASLAAGAVVVWKFSKKNPKTAIAIGLSIFGGGASWSTNTDPRQVLVWANEPLIRPIVEAQERQGQDLRMVKAVVTRMDGADSIIKALENETDSISRDSARRARWAR